MGLGLSETSRNGYKTIGKIVIKQRRKRGAPCSDKQLLIVSAQSVSTMIWTFETWILLLVLNVGNGWVAGGCWDYY